MLDLMSPAALFGFNSYLSEMHIWSINCYSNSFVEVLVPGLNGDPRVVTAVYYYLSVVVELIIKEVIYCKLLLYQKI